MKTLTLLPLLLLAGCQAVNHNYVISATGTIIGVQVAQNAVSQLYEAKLGYARSEVAMVPTNKGTNGVINAGTQGAKDTPSVIMELRYNGIFSLSGGIYQRLAVGDMAVQQPGAALMFAKDQDGSLDPAVANALASVKAVPAADADSISALLPLAKSYATSKTKDLFENVAHQFGYADFGAFLTDKSLTLAKIAEVAAALKAQNLLQ